MIQDQEYLYDGNKQERGVLGKYDKSGFNSRLKPEINGIK